MDVEATETPIAVGDPLLRVRPARHDDELDRVYRLHRSRLTHLAAAITLDRSLAEEVVQDAFVGLQRRRAHVDDLVGYLQRSVVNNSISVLRRRRVAAGLPLPVAAVVVNPEVDETWASVRALPPRERAVVVLRYWQDLSEADIAATLGWPAGTVKSTLHRALKRLREDLDR